MSLPQGVDVGLRTGANDPPASGRVLISMSETGSIAHELVARAPTFQETTVTATDFERTELMVRCGETDDVNPRQPVDDAILPSQQVEAVHIVGTTGAMWDIGVS